MDRTLLLSAAALGAVLLIAPEARLLAQDGAAPVRMPGDYAGVTPEGSNTPPRHGAVQRVTDCRLITWPGFQVRADGGSRFFMQLSTSVQPRVSQSEGRVEVLLSGTSTHLRNTHRYLETRYFNTPVTRARVERRGGDLVFVMHMRAPVSPQVTTRAGANGYQFVFIDFPRGVYVENPAPAPRASSSAADPEPPRSSSPPPRSSPPPQRSRPGQDDERPPGM